MFRYLTAAEAASKLQSSRSHVYELAKQKRLKGLLVEDKYVVTEESVERYLQLKNQLETIKEKMQEQYYARR